MNIDIDKLITIAKKASDAIMEIYSKDFDVEYKEDSSPLTEADIKANTIICDELKKLYPHIPIMSEENDIAPFSVRKNWSEYFCIDPIDGTKEFIKKNGEFSINIAYMKQNIPFMGVVYAPALDELYYSDGQNSFKNGTPLPYMKNSDSFVIATSKSHPSSKTYTYIQELQKTHKNTKLIYKGSSLKLCMVASGEVDIYPRLAPTMEWDTTAADAIVRSAGFMVYEFDTNKPLTYNKKNLLNPRFVVR
jgi:3'(2'), 5'-bisphosphate nucleotidase